MCVPDWRPNAPRREAHPGNKRDDIRSGLRIANYKKRAVIAFDVDAELVSIIGVFYGGQDYGTVLQDESEDGED